MSWIGQIGDFISSFSKNNSKNDNYKNINIENDNSKNDNFENNSNKIDDNFILLETEMSLSKAEPIQNESEENIKLIHFDNQEINQEINREENQTNFNKDIALEIEKLLETETNIFHPSKKQNSMDNFIPKDEISDKNINPSETRDFDLISELINLNGSMVESVLKDLKTSSETLKESNKKATQEMNKEEISKEDNFDRKIIKKRKYNDKKIIVTRRHNLRNTKEREAFHSGIHIYDDNKIIN